MKDTQANKKGFFSEDKEPFTGVLPSNILDDINLIKRYLNKRKLNIVIWNEDSIAVPVTIDVDLPSRGNIDEIDIRKREQILVIFHKDFYPEKAPLVKSDRKNFPRKKLSHLYISAVDEPTSFCLVRGKLDEWFADKKITDLIEIARIWLSKAACGELEEDNNEFDPQRLEGYLGNVIYSYNQLANIVKYQESIDDENFSIFLYEISEEINEKGTSYKIIVPFIDKKTSLEIKELIDKANKVNEKQEKNKSFGIGLLVWSSDKSPIDRLEKLPKTFEELKSICNRELKVYLEDSLNFIFEKELQIFNGIEVIIAVKRSKKIIGYSDNIEFLNFLINASTKYCSNGKINDDAPVSFQSHREPLNSLKAKEISGISNNLGKVLILGCGAIGSKIVMHLVRSGHLNLTIADNSILAPHNLVRHALLSENVNMNKAEALVQEIKNIYKYDNTESINKLTYDISRSNQTDEAIFNGFNIIIDTTASNNVFNSLIKRNLSGPIIIKSEIAYKGQLGLLYLEGKERNPRLDDLLVETYRLSLSNKKIHEWLDFERRILRIDKVNEIISVGVGCHSDTLIMPDDLISLHASIHNNVIKSQDSVNKKNYGEIFISEVNNDDEFNVKSANFKVKSLTILKPLNNKDWQIRLRDGLVDTLLKEFNKAYPNETGGVLMGLSNMKNRTLYLTDIIKAPSDSKATPVCFIRGIKNLPKEVKHYKENTGNLLGYIGEWHTHPVGPNGLSQTDINTLKYLKEMNDLIPIPTFVIIITPKTILPYLF